MSRISYTNLATTTNIKVWEREQSQGQQSVGAFQLDIAKGDFFLYEVEAWELGSFLKDVVLRNDEKLFRYETSTSKIGGFKPVIKVNMKSGLVYFQEDLYMEDITFEKISSKPIWIDFNINQK
jgi:hypothetical protein